MGRIQIEPPDKEPLCCRACLLTDCKLFNIHEYKLADAFNRITGISVFSDVRVPRYLCTYCHTMLLKCVSFRAACLRTQQCLESNLSNGELNTDDLRKIDRVSLRPANLTFAVVEIVEIEQNSAVDKKYAEMMNLRKINEDINNSVKMDVKSNYDFTDDINVDFDDDDGYTGHTDFDHTYVKEAAITKPTIEVIDSTVNKDDLKFELEAIKGGFTLKVLPDSNTKRTRKRKIQDIEDADTSPVLTYEVTYVPKKANQAPKRIKTSLKKKVTTKKNTTTKTRINLANILKDKTDNVTETNTDLIADFNSDDINTNDAASDVWEDPTASTEDPIPYNPPKLKRGRRSKINENIQAKENQQLNGCGRTRAERQKEDNKIFEKKHSVKITLLSKQEQLEEIAARRESAKYKRARFQCKDCGRGFSLVQPYENHLRRHDPICGPYPCPLCGVRFQSKGRLYRHRSMHRTRIVCDLCDFLTRTKGLARIHHNEHLGKIYTCQYCGESYGKVTSFLGHVRLAHPGRHVPCDECGETFIGKGLDMHKRMMHPQSLKKFPCTVCSVRFVSLEALNRHADTDEHVGLSPCEHCGMNCASEEELRSHEAIEHAKTTYICDECRASFSNVAAFEVHVRRKHGGERAGRRQGRRGRDGPAMCDQCGQTFPCGAKLRYHYDLKHSEFSDKPTPKFECPECPKSFTSKASRALHMLCHTDERPYQCPECPLAFRNKSNCVRHHRAVHLGIHENAKCPICERVFTTKASVPMHIKTVHGGQPWPKRNRARASTAKKKNNVES